ncbi:hypothetical protein [Cupriavidus sp. GA3-3]|uniref:hypothetical protein n=1 Tax=Cupriavidus sp. GA3-3 TaxID=1229514 RepID=UPI00143AA43C|nr:hypothetical protein [Cupriavidus sp. GA3-3]
MTGYAASRGTLSLRRSLNDGALQLKMDSKNGAVEKINQAILILLFKKNEARIQKNRIHQGQPARNGMQAAPPP